MTSLQFIQIDLPALLTAVLACTLCAGLGNFLVLRRQALLGDAVSHSVLPGIVIGFLVAGSRATLPMLAGAAAAAAVSAVLIEAVRRQGRVEAGASMGVVFTIMFALGVVLMEQASAHSVDLDADCVLYGQLEDILWLAPTGWGSLLDPAALAELPRELVTLAGLNLVTGLLATAFHKELKITSFDPALANTLGIPAGIFHYGLVLFLALAAVASFEAVGSILVIAMLVCPAAAARMLTDRYGRQLGLSILFGAFSGLAGYLAAAPLPLWLGFDRALSASGAIAVVSGLVLLAAILLGPRHGVLAGRRRAGGSGPAGGWMHPGRTEGAGIRR